MIEANIRYNVTDGNRINLRFGTMWYPICAMKYNHNSGSENKVELSDSMSIGTNQWWGRTNYDEAMRRFDGRSSWNHGTLRCTFMGKHYVFAYGAVFELVLSDPDLGRNTDQYHQRGHYYREDYMNFGNGSRGRNRREGSNSTGDYTLIPIIVGAVHYANKEWIETCLTRNRDNSNSCDLSRAITDPRNSIKMFVHPMLDKPDTPWKAIRKMWRKDGLKESCEEFWIEEREFNLIRDPELPYANVERWLNSEFHHAMHKGVLKLFQSKI